MKKTIAILGASKNRRKFGNKSVRAHLLADFDVFPVNPHASTIEDLPVYRRLRDTPSKLDRISIYLPPRVTEALLPEIAAAESQQVWFNPGSADTSILEKARALGIAVHDGCSIVDIGYSPSDFD